MADPHEMHFLTDIELKQNNFATSMMLNSPALAMFCRAKAVELVRLYQARVGKKTGRLAASADASVRVGGHRMDRVIGVVTINDESVVAEWKGKPFYYGVYHEQGTLNSKRAKRRSRRLPRSGYYELRESAQMWRSQ